MSKLPLETVSRLDQLQGLFAQPLETKQADMVLTQHVEIVEGDDGMSDSSESADRVLTFARINSFRDVIAQRHVVDEHRVGRMRTWFFQYWSFFFADCASRYYWFTLKLYALSRRSQTFYCNASLS